MTGEASSVKLNPSASERFIRQFLLVIKLDLQESTERCRRSPDPDERTERKQDERDLRREYRWIDQFKYITIQLI
jgi:hypothetical protein